MYYRAPWTDLKLSLKHDYFTERSKMVISNLCKKPGRVFEFGNLSFKKYKWFYH